MNSRVATGSRDGGWASHARGTEPMPSSSEPASRCSGLREGKRPMMASCHGRPRALPMGTRANSSLQEGRAVREGPPAANRSKEAPSRRPISEAFPASTEYPVLPSPGSPCKATHPIPSSLRRPPRTASWSAQDGLGPYEAAARAQDRWSGLPSSPSMAGAHVLHPGYFLPSSTRKTLCLSRYMPPGTVGTLPDASCPGRPGSGALSARVLPWYLQHGIPRWYIASLHPADEYLGRTTSPRCTLHTVILGWPHVFDSCLAPKRTASFPSYSPGTPKYPGQDRGRRNPPPRGGPAAFQLALPR